MLHRSVLQKSNCKIIIYGMEKTYKYIVTETDNIMEWNLPRTRERSEYKIQRTQFYLHAARYFIHTKTGIWAYFMKNLFLWIVVFISVISTTLFTLPITLHFKRKIDVLKIIVDRLKHNMYQTYMIRQLCCSTNGIPKRFV